MSHRTFKLQNEIEICTNRAMKVEENLNLSNDLSSLIENKASDTKANETTLEAFMFFLVSLLYSLIPIQMSKILCSF